MLARALEDTPRGFARKMEALASAARANRPGQGLLPGVEAETAARAMGRVLGAFSGTAIAAERESAAPGGDRERGPGFASLAGHREPEPAGPGLSRNEENAPPFYPDQGAGDGRVAHSLGGNTGKALAQPVGVSDALGLVGVLYGRGDLPDLARASGARPGQWVAGATIPASDVPRLVLELSRLGNSRLATAVLQAEHRSAGKPVAMVLLGDDEDTTQRALEEHAHMLQAALSGGHPDDAFNPVDAAGLLARPLWLRADAHLRMLYGPVSSQAAASEVGAHALAGDWRGLGLSPRDGERLRAEYVAALGVVKRALGVKRLAEALPSLLKIQHTIEEPGNPRYALTAGEQSVKHALVLARDAITAHDVARGWRAPAGWGFATAALARGRGRGSGARVLGGGEETTWNGKS